jgi:thiol-disulfide isomerase/thioredoxin
MSSHRRVTRQQVVRGLAATLLSIATARRARARTINVPSFRSGRYQFTLLQPRQTIPSLILFPLHGMPLNLASMRGHPVLLNFWATWCAACRIEMPILDRLQQREALSGLKIIAVSEDRGSRRAVQRFADRLKLRHLRIYLDPHGYVAFHDAANRQHAPFGLYGMPITYAIAASGWIVGYMPGSADWTSPAARELIKYLQES